MTRGLRVLTVLFLLAAGSSIFWTGGRVVAADDPAGVAISAAASVLGEGEFEYVGITKCKSCHVNEHKSWEQTKMSKALNTLRPGEAAEAKKAAGLDPEKDYSKDATCLECHVIGLGKPGGYKLVDDEKKQEQMDKKLGAAGCEACHGPGSEYVKIFSEIQKSQRKYKQTELQAAGLAIVTADSCKTCHNEKSPTHAQDKLGTWDGKDRTGMHEVQELKLREP